jgi:hypothetical protein
MGTKTGSCVLSEIKITGVETIDNNDATRSCSAELITNENTTTALSFGNVQY